MRLWMVAPLAGLTLAASAVAQESTSTASYTHVLNGAASGHGTAASTGATYGRIDEVGALFANRALPSLGSGSYALDLGSVSMNMPSLDFFALLAIAPNAGFSASSVIVPRDPSMAGDLTVRFDGLLASDLGPAGDNLRVAAPSHAPGPVDVTVESATKTVTFESGFAYIPALSSPSETHRGASLQLRVSGSPGATFWIFVADSLSAPFTFVDIAGSLDLDFATLNALGVASVPPTMNGAPATYEAFLSVPVPDDPALTGRTFFLQAYTVDEALPGTHAAFTNHAAVTVKS